MMANLLLQTILISYFLRGYNALPRPDTTPSDFTDDDVERYMIHAGFLASANASPDSPLAQVQAHNVSAAIAAFQRMYDLNVTGILDPETRYWIQLPRCGRPDVEKPEDMSRRKKRYDLQGGKWDRTSLTYRITDFPDDDLSQTRTLEEIDRAINVWSQVTPLSFERRSSGAVDIQVLFGSGNHGDNAPFDGYGNILAHALFPQYGGDAHFDDDEQWTAGINTGTNLFQVAAHEFGHSLGLGHSDVRDALMAPFYTGYKPNFKLDQDDINGIQHLYGRRSNAPTTSRPRPGPTVVIPEGMPDFCANARFDAVTLHEVNGVVYTYVFIGGYYARLSRTGMDPGYPRLISEDWPELPSNLDTALYWEISNIYGYVNGIRTIIGTEPSRTYFFKGDKYWRYENMNLLETYPRPISENWWGIPNDVDAAFVWSGNGKTYFIKGNEYYRYQTRRGVDQGYPRPLTVWTGLPSSIDAAVQWINRRTYFFVGTQYYRFDDTNFRVDSNNYPRNNDYWWLGCSGMNMLLEDDDTYQENAYSGEESDQNTNDNNSDSSVGLRNAFNHCLILTLFALLLVMF